MTLVVGGVDATRRRRGPVARAEEVLATLPTGGAVLVGDRRHGKTSLSRLVQRSATAQGAMVVAVSAERETFAEFITTLAAELAASHDPAWATELTKWRLTVTAGPVKLERTGQAAGALDDLLHRAIDRARGRLLALFDEVTILARNLERQNPGTGDSFLHLLRRFRQENTGRIATVLSGSIGFHHVSADAPSTVNDIPKIAVGPIRSDHAAYLAECLLLGSDTPTVDPPAVAAAIAAAAENVPYYIQHLVAAAHEPLAQHVGTTVKSRDVVYDVVG